MTNITNMKIYRQLKGLTQTAVAQRVGITRQTYNNYELGKRQADYETLLKIAEVLDTSVDQIITKDNPDFSSETKPAITDDDIKFALWGGAEGITDEMYEEVKQYAEMVQLREERKKTVDKKNRE